MSGPRTRSMRPILRCVSLVLSQQVLGRLTKVGRSTSLDNLALAHRSALFAERNLIEETNFGPSLENNGLVARAFRICKCTHGLSTLVLEASKKLVELLDTERLHKPFTESR